MPAFTSISVPKAPQALLSSLYCVEIENQLRFSSTAGQAKAIQQEGIID